MKKIFSAILIKWFFATAFLVVTAVACTKPKTDLDFQLPRNFKPGDIKIAAGETQAVLSWNPSLFTTTKTVSYTVQVAKDTSFQGSGVITKQVDSSSVTLTDAELEVNQSYYARVKANASGSTAESGWVLSDAFKITGEQIFLAILDTDVKDTTVLLKWRPTAGLTTIRLTPAVGSVTTVNLTAADVAANQKLISGLKPLTTYTAQIFRNTLLKGTISFTTKEKSLFNVILSPGDDLVAAINNAANGDIIGLEPGTYDATNATGSYVNFVVQQKILTIQSRSGNPSNTIVNSKQFDIKGTGAGLILKGITFNGTAANADYFINFVGLNADSENATFTKVMMDNVVVKYTNNALVRGNRVSANGGFKIDSIQLKNSIFSENGSGGFDYILLDKMEFKSLELLNSTFYNSGRRLISWATNFTASQRPVVLIDKVTINSIGYSGRDNVLLDANSNPIDFTMKNSILANAPKPGQTLGNNLLRVGSGSNALIGYSDLFNLTNGATTPAALVIPTSVVLQNNISVDLGWTGTTTSFTLPPPPSPVRTASETGGPIGDPRWW